MDNMADKEIFDVVIIGSGPAGLTAGIYTSRANLKTLLVAGHAWGGQLMLTTLVENYPGFPEGIQGPDLMTNMRKQAEKFGVIIVDGDATAVEFGTRPFKVITDGKTKYQGKSVIIATGAEFNWLGLPSEQRLIGRGVSSCATCDAAFFKDKKVIVVGGGDAAMEEALVLAKYASEVTVVHRREAFRASKIMQDRVLSHPKIKVKWNTTVVEILGENKVEGVKLKTQMTNNKSMTNDQMSNEEIQDFPVDGVFVAIGHLPATKVFADKIDLDARGFVTKKKRGEILNDKGEVIGYKYSMATSVDGVFAAGDIHDLHYKQAVTAAAYGCEAALEVEKWLEED